MIIARKPLSCNSHNYITISSAKTAPENKTFPQATLREHLL